MLLTTLVDTLVTHLNDRVLKWTAEDITVKAELDVMPDSVDALSVFIVPHFFQPTVDRLHTRGNRSLNKNINELLIVQLMLAKKFTELPSSTTVGIGNWATDVKPMIDTWQRATEQLILWETSEVTLQDIEPGPPEPIELDNRVYAVLTTFSWSTSPCVTAHELPSS